MDSSKLDKIVEKIELKERWFQERDAYAKGLNPVIYQELPKQAPDFRISVPFVKKAIQQYSGFMLKSGSITYSGKYFDTVLKPIFNFNNEELLSSLEFDDALKYGKCYELHWTTDDGKIKKFYPIPTCQGYPVFSDDLEKTLIGFYWYREVENDDEEYELITFYDSEKQFDYQKKENDKQWTLLQETPHSYGKVPVNIGYISKDKTNIFDHVKELVDFYDKLISGDIANESQRFANAILLMKTSLSQVVDPVTGKTAYDQFKEILTLEGLDDPTKDVAYLNRNIPTEFITLALKTVYDHIHDMTPMIDQRNDSIGNVSGVAMEYKLLPFELKCSEIEANWSLFLQNRIKLIVGSESKLGREGINDVQISFKRNLPKNITEIADNAAKLKGILSDETILRLFPTDIISDVKKELEMIKLEQPEVVMPNAT